MDGWCEGSSWEEAWTVERGCQRSETLEKSDYGSHQEPHEDRRNLMMTPWVSNINSEYGKGEKVK